MFAMPVGGPPTRPCLQGMVVLDQLFLLVVSLGSVPQTLMKVFMFHQSVCPSCAFKSDLIEEPRLKLR